MWGDTLAPEDLRNRPFRWGVTDCWSAVRDGLRELFMERVGNYPRAWQFWTHLDSAPFEQNLRAEGFTIVSEDPSRAIPGDVVLLKLRSAVYNHAALVVDENTIYHHLAGPKPFDPTYLPRVEALDRYAAFPLAVCRRL
jgi:hypothetical protein